MDKKEPVADTFENGEYLLLNFEANDVSICERQRKNHDAVVLDCDRIESATDWVRNHLVWELCVHGDANLTCIGVSTRLRSFTTGLANWHRR